MGDDPTVLEIDALIDLSEYSPGLEAMVDETQAATADVSEGFSRAAVGSNDLWESLHRDTTAAHETAAALNETGAAADRAAYSMQNYGASTSEARATAGVLTNSTGMLANGLARLAFQSSTLGPILQGAFPLILVGAFVEGIVELVGRFEDWRKELEQAKFEEEDLAATSYAVAAAIETENLKLDDQIAKLEGRPVQNLPKEALLEDVKAAEDLSKALEDTLSKMNDILEKGPGPIETLFAGAATGNESDVAKRLQPTINQITSARLQLAQAQNEIANAPAGSEEQKAAVKNQQSAIQEQITLYTKLNEQIKMEELNYRAMAGSSGDLGDSIAKLQDLQIAIGNAQEALTEMQAQGPKRTEIANLTTNKEENTVTTTQDKAEFEGKKEIADAVAEYESDVAKRSMETRQITVTQETDDLRAAYLTRYQAQHDELEAELADARAGGPAKAADAARINDQIVALEITKVKDLGDIDAAGVEESKRQFEDDTRAKVVAAHGNATQQEQILDEALAIAARDYGSDLDLYRRLQGQKVEVTDAATRQILDQLKLQDEAANRKEAGTTAVDVSGLEEQRKQIEALSEAGVISKLQELEATKRLQAAEAAATIQELEDQRKRLQGELDLAKARGADTSEVARDEAAVAAADARIVEEQNKAANQVKDNDQKIALQRLAIWTQLNNQMASQFGSTVTKIITHQESLRTGFQKLGQQIESDLVSLLVRQLEKWIEYFLAQAALGLISQTTQTAQVTTGTATRAAIEMAAALKSIGHAAATAAAAVFASVMVALPFPINVIVAPIAAAGAAAAVFAFEALAEQGFDVEKDTVTMLHAKEMVLPAPLAEGVRGIIDAGGAGVFETLTSIGAGGPGGAATAIGGLGGPGGSTAAVGGEAGIAGNGTGVGGPGGSGIGGPGGIGAGGSGGEAETVSSGGDGIGIGGPGGTGVGGSSIIDVRGPGATTAGGVATGDTFFNAFEDRASTNQATVAERFGGGGIATGPADVTKQLGGGGIATGPTLPARTETASTAGVTTRGDVPTSPGAGGAPAGTAADTSAPFVSAGETGTPVVGQARGVEAINTGGVIKSPSVETHGNDATVSDALAGRSAVGDFGVGSTGAAGRDVTTGTVPTPGAGNRFAIGDFGVGSTGAAGKNVTAGSAPGIAVGDQAAADVNATAIQVPTGVLAATSNLATAGGAGGPGGPGGKGSGSTTRVTNHIKPNITIVHQGTNLTDDAITDAVHRGLRRGTLKLTR